MRFQLKNKNKLEVSQTLFKILSFVTYKVHISYFPIRDNIFQIYILTKFQTI